MEAAFVEIGLEKNGFLYVDEIVAPELEGRAHGRKIQDLLSRGQEILVQAVKDPMKSKGARLTTEISLPGPLRRLRPAAARASASRAGSRTTSARACATSSRRSTLKKGGVIVRTAAEGASAEDIERDLVFLQRLWKTIQARAKSGEGAGARLPGGRAAAARRSATSSPSDFERALVDDDRTLQAHRRLPEEDLAAHGRARRPLPREDAAVRGATASTPRSARRSRAASTCPPAATSSSTTPRRSPSST